jgi:hypothetical protein
VAGVHEKAGTLPIWLVFALRIDGDVEDAAERGDSVAADAPVDVSVSCSLLNRNRGQ